MRLRRLNTWMYRRALGYDGEICHDCGHPVVQASGSYWSAPDDLWLRVVGNDHTILCQPCFVARARAKAILVHWLAVEDMFIFVPPMCDGRDPPETTEFDSDYIGRVS